MKNKKEKIDHKLMKSIKDAHKSKSKHKKTKSKSKSIVKSKMTKVMDEYKAGELHSGSKKGPVVNNPKQAIAIGLSEARSRGAKIPKKKK